MAARTSGPATTSSIARRIWSLSQDAIHELVRARAFQRVVDGPVERSALCELLDHPLEHAMLHERARDLLRQRAREGAVDQARDLGNEHVVCRSPELVARGPRRGACGKEGEPTCDRRES